MADREKVLTQLAGIGIGLDMAGYHNDAQCVRDALAMLRKPARGWIPVKDRLPEKNVPVLVWEKQGFAYVDRLEAECAWQIASTHEAIITHWMPLPEPPEEVSGDG